jgi:hypothetical protein
MNRVYGCIRNENQQAAEALAQHLRNGDLKLVRSRYGKLAAGFTSYDVQRMRWSGLAKEHQVQYAVDTLEYNGWIRVMPPEPTRGRPAVRWEINPAIYHS